MDHHPGLHKRKLEEKFTDTILKKGYVRNGQNKNIDGCAAINESSNTKVLTNILPELVTGFCFWSLLHGLPPLIWFYPLNELKLSGYEVFAIFFFSPAVLFVPNVLEKISTTKGALSLRSIMVVGIASFQTQSTFPRLAMLSVGTSAALLWLAVIFWSKNTFKRSVMFWAVMLSYLYYLSLRVWYNSVSLAWNDPLSNAVVIVLAAGANVLSARSKWDDTLHKLSPEELPAVPGRPWSVLCGAGLGAWLYLTHTLYGEVSLVCRWVGRAHPNTGPSPDVAGVFILVGLSVGLVLGAQVPSMATSVTWLLLGATCSAAVYLLPRTSGYLAGVMLSVYLTSVVSLLLSRSVRHSPQVVLTAALLTYVAAMFTSIWTIAYNFVPLGELTREHTGCLLAVMVLLLAAATVLHPLVRGEEKFVISSTGYFDVPAIGKLHIALLWLGAIVLATVGFITRTTTIKPTFSANRQPDILTTAVWAYHFGYDNEGWPSLDRAAWFLNETGADVIALLESDASKPFLGNNDLALWFSQRLDMYVDFGPSTKDHTWGTLLLSKYPIKKSTHHLLPSPEGELAPAVSATLDMAGQPVHVIATHMGNDRDDVDRRLQAAALAGLAATVTDTPLVFLGYITSQPGSRDYTTLIRGGRLRDIEPGDKDRWCEYIMYKNMARLSYARITHGGLSDTELQVAKFRVVPAGQPTPQPGNVVTDSKKVDPSVAFSSRFFKPKRPGGHKFHMNTPKYFV